MKEIVSNLKALDFHWETYDPFLFCAHHYDHYPRGMTGRVRTPRFKTG